MKITSEIEELHTKRAAVEVSFIKFCMNTILYEVFYFICTRMIFICVCAGKDARDDPEFSIAAAEAASV